MYDFLRVTCAVPETVVACPEKNKDNILNMLKKLSADKPDIAAFPELCITGYTCADLFFQNALVSGALEALRCLVKESVNFSFPFVVGIPLELDGRLYNCAVVISDGKIAGIVPKSFIPGYNEFYEKRWFASSFDLIETEVNSDELGLCGNYNIPMGRDLIFEIGEGFKFAVEICEDLWSPLPPSTFLTLSGAELIINISASNETIAKRKYRRDLVCQQSARCLCAYMYTSAGSGESTTDLIFSGHALIAENGTVAAENKNTIDTDYFLTADVDMGKIRADRKKITTYRDASAMYGGFQRARCVSAAKFAVNADASMANINKAPFVPSVKKDRGDRCRAIFEMQVAGLKKRLSVTGARPVVGVSGGLDSTLALLVSVKAVSEMGKPASNVCGVTLPCFGTSDRTHSNAVSLMRALKVTCKEINIKKACELHFENIGQSPDSYDLTYENSQARERTQVLMDYAGKIGGLVVGTGDLSELALGWCTYNADHMSMYSVNSSIPKTLIKWMIETICESEIFPECSEILRDITATPISPELVPPDSSGNISQETESLIGPYELHDFFMYNILRYGFEPEKVYRLAVLAFKDEYGADVILKWLRSFYRRFFTQQFKRSCLPDGVKVGSICLSPRGDWRMPSDASAAQWLARIDRL